MTTQMVFLVGGLGTRLGERSRGLPKPLQPVAGKPFLAHMVEYGARLGVEHFVLLAGHLGELVREQARDFPGKVEVLIEPEPLGTGGALRFGRAALAETFLMANGDSFFGFDWSDLARGAPGECTGRLALRRIEDASRYGVVELNGDRISGFRERGDAAPALINGGVYFLRRELVDLIGDGPQSLERDVFPELAAQGRLAGKAYDGPFIDIGVPEDLDRAQIELPSMIEVARG